MNTLTPRNPSGQFQSWNVKVKQAGSYGPAEVAVAAVGAAIVALVTWAFTKEKKDD